MLYCKSCGYEFEKPQKLFEKHNLETPPYEEINVCPACNSADIAEKITRHCKCCGAKLKDGAKDYCSKECRENGLRLQKIENRRRKIVYESPLNEIVRLTEIYNKQNNTRYSYGQYVAFVLPKMKAEKKKCKKKKSNT